MIMLTPSASNSTLQVKMHMHRNYHEGRERSSYMTHYDHQYKMEEKIHNAVKGKGVTICILTGYK